MAYGIFDENGKRVGTKYFFVADVAKAYAKKCRSKGAHVETLNFGEGAPKRKRKRK